MKISSSIKLLLRKNHLLALSALLLISLPAQAVENQFISEDKAHGLYHAGARYGEQSETLFVGRVQKSPQNDRVGTWVVDGSDILVSESTVIQGKPVVGSFVELEGSWLVLNKIFKAYDIRLLDQVDPFATGKFIGIIDKMPSFKWPYGSWIVDNRRINVPKGLTINEQGGKAKIGAKVVIKGSYVDGVFTASEFKINPPESLR
ncbi:hypothetical protein VU04_05340 [Desulfobulbus sp. TB]|nr:hypothetical protein [Desulfobulbus sp. TB]